MKHIAKPKPSEYPEYASRYITLMPDDGQLLKHLNNNFHTIKKLVLSLPKEKLTYRYAEGKWTIKDILVHIIDDERIYAYRALRFARNDQTPLPGFEQDDFANSARANDRDLSNILAEYEAVRNSTIAMLESFNEEELSRSGVANENRSTVRALAYHLAGHEVHHLNIVRERYL